MSQKFVIFLWIGIVLVLALILTGCGEKDVPIPSAPTAEDAPATEESILETIQVIEERVSELRGLETLKPVTKAFLTTDELRQRVIEDLSDYTEKDARDDVLLYVAFGLVEQDVDLYNLLVDLQTEQVAGFYDADTEEIYLVEGGQGLGAMEQSVLSHEYTHALQDQHFDLEALGFTDEEEEKEEDGEQNFATRCLVEGDAVLLQQQYLFNHFEVEDLQEMLEQIEEVDSSVLDSAPVIVQQSLMFPYEAGLTFVTSLYAEGG